MQDNTKAAKAGKPVVKAADGSKAAHGKAAGRDADNVTTIRRGNNVLTVYGYYKQGATETAVDKMKRVLRTEAALGDTDDCA